VSEESEPATVLMVDDEQEVADVYALRLRNTYETRVAYSGEEALDAIDSEIDIVLLDRRMPDTSGDDVLAEIRKRDYDCRIIMLTAVDPGLDIVDMPFDDYLCKPVEKEDLVAAIEQQLRVRSYDEQLSEYLEVTSKLALLESELPPKEQDKNEELTRLQRRLDQLRTELADVLTDVEELESTFREIGRHPK
jgi:DNA-binding response OmpR family regulator